MNSDYPDEKLHRMVRNYQAEHPSLGYSKCLSLVAQTDEGARLMAEYNSNYRMPRARRFETCPGCEHSITCRHQKKCLKQMRGLAKDGKYAEPVAEMTSRARQLMVDRKAKNFSDAVRLIMIADPDLAVEYASWIVNSRG